MTRAVRNRRAAEPTSPVAARVEDISSDGRGVCRVDGKVVLVHGALPGEEIEFHFTGRRRSHDEGTLSRVVTASPDRVEPACAHFAVCGGCALQHLSPEAQIGHKEDQLFDALARIGRVSSAERFAPLTGESPWGYRRKARLGVRYVRKKERVLVGFRERGSSLLADIDRCIVLHPKVGDLITPLAELIAALSIRERIPQIEVAMDDHRLVLILRVLDDPTAVDRDALARFAAVHDLCFYLQPAGPDSVVPLAEPIDLAYELPDSGVTLGFRPTDFTQVNLDINRRLVTRALELLDVHQGNRVLDLFCGIGNFTLPLARRAGAVLGIEGDAGLVARARDNATANALPDARFAVANLYDSDVLSGAPWWRETYDRVLLDPPRSGALALMPVLGRLRPPRILYVSCNPATLARDAAELVHRHDYRLSGAGVVDMFPHTRHVESMALFIRSDHGH